ncbi:MAG: phytanoyl-CoA dioxygenase family protein [Planctomycetes bacterium]|nr:phytanoyl-CoA dioxygenase family protein [Planctomycetota bacterium]
MRFFSADEDFVGHFDEHGFAAIRGLLSTEEVEEYRRLYARFLSGAIEVGPHRSDLASHCDPHKVGVENVTQIMWPSHHVPELHERVLHRRCLALARRLLGPDVAFDFDMLIDKAPETNTSTPWHQDAAYWPDLPDKRAASFWVALDPATRENGCMWFVPGSHGQPMRPHRSAGPGGGFFTCDASEAEAVAIELDPGGCTIHHGHMLHYTRGNSTGTRRRAFILNYRPQAMIEIERERGFDHGLHDNVRRVRNVQAEATLPR